MNSDGNLNGEVMPSGKEVSLDYFDVYRDEQLKKVKKSRLRTDTVRKIHGESMVFSETIEDFVVKAQDGDADSFAKVYDVLVDQIYRYVYFRVPQEEAEDITEMVFLRAWENLHQYRLKKKSFSAWIFKIAHNLIVDTYRFKRDKGTVSLDPDVPEYRREHNPIKVAEDNIHSDKLRIALSKMKKAYKQIIILKFINEFSNEEISKILKKSEGSIRILQFRALKTLKRELIELGVDFV